MSYGIALEMICYDKTTVVLVVNEKNNPQEYLTQASSAPEIEHIRIRPATEQEWLNQFKIEQAFREALASFDNPIDPVLKMLSYQD
jgi:hypothetical protein